jgi:hypothetical protein
MGIVNSICSPLWPASSWSKASLLPIFRTAESCFPKKSFLLPPNYILQHHTANFIQKPPRPAITQWSTMIWGIHSFGIHPPNGSNHMLESRQQITQFLTWDRWPDQWWEVVFNKRARQHQVLCLPVQCFACLENTLIINRLKDIIHVPHCWEALQPMSVGTQETVKPWNRLGRLVTTKTEHISNN